LSDEARLRRPLNLGKAQSLGPSRRLALSFVLPMRVGHLKLQLRHKRRMRRKVAEPG
jgi:hypothetical protein